MHPSLRVSSARVHKPLIHFLGKRTWPAKPEAPHAHPAGPPEYKTHFLDFLKKFESSGSTPIASGARKDEERIVYEEFWQAPSRIWQPRVRQLSEEEMEAVVTGGASLR